VPDEIGYYHLGIIRLVVEAIYKAWGINYGDLSVDSKKEIYKSEADIVIGKIGDSPIKRRAYIIKKPK
jgi:hypothetical protein